MPVGTAALGDRVCFGCPAAFATRLGQTAYVVAVAVGH